MNNFANVNKIKNLFLRQAYLDAWEDYQNSITKNGFIKWDYVILTASNESQAEAFRFQIERRKSQGLLPEKTVYAVLPDPDGKRVGSGGATFNVLRYINTQCGKDMFKNKRVLVIHCGGDSKRIPQYSAIGKLFSPVPRELPDGRPSTLFDEIIVGTSGVPRRFKEGMLVLSGDIQLIFNPLQIDSQFNGAAAVSIKESVSVGKNHGVFLCDGKGNVKKFLHKKSESELNAAGAVNKFGKVDLDTGAILLDANLLNALFSLISTDGVTDDDKFNEFVNEQARLSFYGDFLYPLAGDAILSDYFNEKPEGENTPELHSCRKKIWETIHNYSLKLICLSPAKFIHFGTTHELLSLVAEKIDDYEFLGWKSKTKSIEKEYNGCSLYCSFIDDAAIGKHSYIENSYVHNSKIGCSSIVSSLSLKDCVVPDKTVLHGLKLKDGRFTVRIYGVNDSPKEPLLKSSFSSVCEKLNLAPTQNLWNAPLYPVCENLSDALSLSLRLYSGDISQNEFDSLEKISLCDSFNTADIRASVEWQENLESKILCKIFVQKLLSGIHCDEALKVFGGNGITRFAFNTLVSEAEDAEHSTSIRIYYALSRYMKLKQVKFDELSYDDFEEKCFSTIKSKVYDETIKKLPDISGQVISSDSVKISLPVRVNWGGVWSDTPPYCYENGGAVLNAAVSINGALPVQIHIRRLQDLHVEFESRDIGVHEIVDTADDIRDCLNPYDPFALHKAALISCGVISLFDNGESLQDVLRRIGGGIYLSTQVIGIPKGSGLGTSSILAAACVKGIYRFFGIEKSNEDIYRIVLGMEQLMSTGGGWQDQVGGLTAGIKFITTSPGLPQDVKVTQINVPDAAMTELSERFALIYTGQRRLARNLLRDVVGSYIGAKPSVMSALKEIKGISSLMAYQLNQGNIDEFAALLDRHWNLSKQIDAGSTNSCIDHIFLACDDLIDARFITGAGGGGFLMVILKKGVSKDALRQRLYEVFQDSGIDVWDSSFI